MKTTISVPIPEGAEILVKVGDIIKKGDPLAKTKDTSQILDIDMAKILGVKPQNISKYIKKRIGDNLGKDEVLAFKKSFFSSTSVKSPTEGMIEAIDLKMGSVSFKSKQDVERKIHAPLTGKIKSINDKNIEVEFEGQEYTGQKGKGKRVRGTLYFIKGETISVLDIYRVEDDTVVLVKNPTEAAIAKLDALGGTGVVSTKAFEDSTLPYITVSDETFSKLEENNGKTVILDPEKARIVVVN